MKIFRSLSFGLVVMAWLLGVPGANADIASDLSNTIRIEEATVSSGQAGGKSRLRFQVINGSPASIHLLGISTPVAGKAELIAGLGHGKATVFDSIGVPPSETLDLTTFHLRFEIFPLKRALVSGTDIPVTLNFVGWSVTVPVHVH